MFVNRVKSYFSQLVSAHGRFQGDFIIMSDLQIWRQIYAVFNISL